MLDTVPDYVYNVKKYMSYEWDEFVGFLVTSLFAAFIITFNDWGQETFDLAIGLKALLSVFFFLFIAIFIAVTVCKLIAVRLGYELKYRPHLLGMMFGLIIAVASAGWLPIFLPGGFDYHKPERRYPGHWRGYHRPWEIPIVSGTFVLMMLAYILILNPIYLATGSFVIYKFIVTCCLTAVFALLPIPNVALEYGGRVLDFFRYLRGTTFGLEIFFNSRTYYVVLATFTLLASILAYVITRVGGKVGILLYALLFLIGLVVLFFYKNWLEKDAFGATWR